MAIHGTKKTLLAIMLICICSLSWAIMPSEDTQRFFFQRIDTEHGLSQDSVTDIIQDSMGFIWVATIDGLNRYDGYDFVVYRSHPLGSHSISDNRVKTLQEDNSGSLWIGTDDGLNRLNLKTDDVRQYKHDPKNPSGLSHNRVYKIIKDKKGTLFISTSGGLNRYDPRTDGFIYCEHPYRSSHKKTFQWVFGKLADRSGGLLFICDQEIFEWDADKHKFVSFAERFPGFSMAKFPQSLMNSFIKDKRGVYWFAFKNGCLSSFNPQTKESKTFFRQPSDSNSLLGNSIESLQETSDGHLWLGTFYGGLIRFDPVSGNFTRYVHNPSNPNSIGNNVVEAIMEDASHLLWIGTYGAGITKIKQKRIFFKTFSHSPDDPNSLSNYSIHSFVETPDGTMWIGTQNGLDKWERTKNRFIHYFQNTENESVFRKYNVRALNADTSGDIWIGTQNGLDRFTPSTGKIFRYLHVPSDPASLSFNSVKAIIRDKRGVLWVGTEKGLNRLNPDNKTFTRFYHDGHNSNSLSHDYIYTLYMGSGNQLWIGTKGGGLNRLDLNTGLFYRYPFIGNDESSGKALSNPTVLSIYEDTSGTLWVGTLSGLNRLNTGSESFTHYFEADGLCNRTIYGILEDRQGQLWMSTNKGISCFNLRSQTFRNYYASDGLQNNEFNGSAFCKTKKGEMFFGGIFGFNLFIPEEIASGFYIPPVVITRFRIFNQPVPLKNLMSLSYKDYSFSIEFSALDFENPSKNQYAYMLEGLDKKWNYSENRRFVTYTNLEPRNYVFHVKGTNEDGFSNEAGTSLKIIVEPPFWVRWWFRLLVLAMIVLGIIAFVKFRVSEIRVRMNRKIGQKLALQRMRLEKENLEKELKLKADFTAMLVHDLRSPLTVVLGYAELMTITPETLDIPRTATAISRSSERMLELINDMLDLAKFEAGKMDLNKVTVQLESLLVEITEIMQPLFKQKAIDVILELDKLRSIEADRYRIDQVLQNLLNNAVKFSPQQGKITIQLKESQRTMTSYQEIRIIDEGPGIPVEKQSHLFEKYSQLHHSSVHKGTGLGLAVSRLIVEAHGGEIGYEPNEPGGSIFYVCLPEYSKLPPLII